MKDSKGKKNSKGRRPVRVFLSVLGQREKSRLVHMRCGQSNTAAILPSLTETQLTVFTALVSFTSLPLVKSVIIKAAPEIQTATFQQLETSKNCLYCGLQSYICLKHQAWDTLQVITD